MPNDLSDALAALAAEDPRLNVDFWRVLPGDERRGAVVLVGVVHDHPASSHRVRTVGNELESDVLAVELPSLAVPAFERDSGDGGDSEECGEMRAAIASEAGGDGVVGIDTFGHRFLRRFTANARSEGASLRTVRDAVAAIGSIARDAVSHRLGVVDARRRRPELDYGVTAEDPPAEQARDERVHVARSRSLLGAVERPHADLLLDETREENMAARLDSLRNEGSVLAVVGMDHLDGIAARLE